MRDILEMIIVLSTICVMAAISLAKVYDLTKEPIASQRRLARLQMINGVLAPHDNEPDQSAVQIPLDTNDGKNRSVLVYRGFQNGKLTGVAFEMTALGYGGQIGVMIGLDPDGTIRGIEITSMNETPGLGAKITEPQFKEQFQGRSLVNARFKVKKDGGDFDQIAGATISPRAVVQAVREGLELYRKHKEAIVR